MAGIRRALEAISGAGGVAFRALTSKQHDAHVVKRVCTAAAFRRQREEFERFFVVARDACRLALEVRKSKLEAALAAATPASKRETMQNTAARDAGGAPRGGLVVFNPSHYVTVVAAVIAVQVSRADGTQLFAKAW